MKKLHTLLFLALVVLVACSSSKSDADEDDYETDTEKVEATAKASSQAELELAEARADSIRIQHEKDSIEALQKEIQNRLAITHFCEWRPDDQVIAQRSLQEVKSNLAKIGFTKLSEKSRTYSEDCCGMVTETQVVFKRNSNGKEIKIETTYGLAPTTKITFSDADDKNNFVGSIAQNKFQKINANEYSGGDRNITYWIGTDVFINGNTVTLQERFEP